jgi:preprotein translocase subunit SecG
MFVDCVLLVFLVLLQLPKKDAGAGMAFGGAATDALFGAGSGNVLTKITKYMAGIFFGLALLMAILAAHRPKSDAAQLAEKLIQRTGAPLAQPSATESTPASTTPGAGLLQLSNLPPAATSNAGAPAAQLSSPPPASTVKTNK